MKIVDVQQGTPEWLAVRVGRATASRADDLITPRTGKPSASMAKYAFEILAEEILGRPVDDATSGFMERGKELEEGARAWYAFDQDVEVQRVGFVMRDDERVGCSPDGLVGEEGCIEIKCPSAVIHMQYLLGNPADNKYYSQMMFTLWIMERQWIDFTSFCPGLPPVLVRFQRDEPFIAKLAACVDTFLEMLDGHRARLISMETVTL